MKGELKRWLSRDLYLTTELFNRLPFGLLPEELRGYLDFIAEADDYYEQIHPNLLAKLGEQQLVLRNGPTKYTYRTLEANMKVMRLGIGKWHPNMRSAYQYLTLYRPKLWWELSQAWYEDAKERIELLTKAPPLDSFMYD
jgi:hypothetical protein